MPAVSEAQRKMLNAHFGHAWVKEHGFNNKGPLPKYKNKRAKKKKAVRNRKR